MGGKLLFKIYHEWQLKITPKSIHFQISIFGKISPVKKKVGTQIWGIALWWERATADVIPSTQEKKKYFFLFKMNSIKNPQKKTKKKQLGIQKN